MAVPLMTESLLTKYNCSSDFRPSHLRQSRTVDQATFGRVENKKKIKKYHTLDRVPMTECQIVNVLR